MKRLLEYFSLSVSAADAAWKVFAFLVIAAGSTTAGVLAAGSALLGSAGWLVWFSVAVAAGLAFCLMLYLVAAASQARAAASLSTAMASRPNVVNPLAKSFEDMVIPIESLKLPGMQVHEYKSFQRCKFVGPGAMAFLGGTFVMSRFNNIGQVLTLPEEVSITGITVLKECTLQDCEFITVSILVPKQTAEQMKKSIPGIQIAVS
jgi:hypothetical protein